MRFLVDAQLPPALAQFLRECGHEAEQKLRPLVKGIVDRLQQGERLVEVI